MFLDKYFYIIKVFWKGFSKESQFFTAPFLKYSIKFLFVVGRLDLKIGVQLAEIFSGGFYVP